MIPGGKYTIAFWLCVRLDDHGVRTVQIAKSISILPFSLAFFWLVSSGWGYVSGFVSSGVRLLKNYGREID